MATNQVTRTETIGSFLLWYAVLAGPLAWSAQLVLAYGLSEVMCGPGNTRPGTFFGLGLGALVQIVNAIATAATVLAFVVAASCHRRLREDATEAQRARWMASAGMFNSALFLIIIGLKFASPFFLTSCRPPL
jgi:hypothetical protein